MNNNRILFVEDTADTRELIEFALKQEGFEVVSALNAEDGLRRVSEDDDFALILLDVGLPDRDGLELCRDIRRINQHTPVLFFTAFADLLDHAEAQRAGAQGCLRKPEDTNRLPSVIKTLVDASGGV